jgi:hypothetical protein
LRWCLDDAVLYFGRWVDSHLAQRDKKGKRIYTLNRILDPSFTEASKYNKSLAGLMAIAGNFAGPAASS